MDSENLNRITRVIQNVGPGRKFSTAAGLARPRILRGIGPGPRPDFLDRTSRQVDARQRPRPPEVRRSSKSMEHNVDKVWKHNILRSWVRPLDVSLKNIN